MSGNVGEIKMTTSMTNPLLDNPPKFKEAFLKSMKGDLTFISTFYFHGITSPKRIFQTIEWDFLDLDLLGVYIDLLLTFLMFLGSTGYILLDLLTLTCYGIKKLGRLVFPKKSSPRYVE